jgi:hypothetical protein
MAESEFNPKPERLAKALGPKSKIKNIIAPYMILATFSSVSKYKNLLKAMFLLNKYLTFANLGTSLQSFCTCKELMKLDF